MSGTYETRVTRLHVVPKGEPIFSEAATVVEIEDEAAGEFVVIRQQYSDTHEKNQQIGVNDASEWAAIISAVDRLLSECRKETK